MNKSGGGKKQTKLKRKLQRKDGKDEEK